MGESSSVLEVQKQAIASTIEFMRRDLSTPVTLRDLADFASYSPFHFARVFRSAVGVPPAEFRAALRFDWAKHLLLTTDLSVTEVCFEVGFDSLGTFSSRFTELVGVTPKKFRLLPELLDGSSYSSVVQRGSAGGQAIVSGTVTAEGCGPVYIGLFPDRIARCRPIAGVFLPEPGTFEIAPVPVGTFHLLAAGFPPGTDTRGQMLPDDRLRVGSVPEPIAVKTPTAHVTCSLTLGQHAHNDTPLLVALPPLLQPR